MNILITGGGGYLGKQIASYFSNKYHVTNPTRAELNLLDVSFCKSFFANKTFDVVFHTAITGGSRLQNDEFDVYEKNLLMFNNLLACKKNFGKLINFGSGAEIHARDTPYGLSKRTISNIIEQTHNAYNIRIYGVFDYEELSTRFIKSCIINCITNKPIIIHQNKLFDFFYMEDLLTVLQYYITSNSLAKTIDTVYPTKVSLLEIAKFICKQFDINPSDAINIIDSSPGIDYIGKSELPDLSFIGLEEGIVETKNKIVQNLIY